MLEVSYRKVNSKAQLGTLRLNSNDLKSSADFINAFRTAAKAMDSGTYTIYDGKNIFARVDIQNKQPTRLHKWSENTGMVMPCWKLFDEKNEN